MLALPIVLLYLALVIAAALAAHRKLAAPWGLFILGGLTFFPASVIGGGIGTVIMRWVGSQDPAILLLPGLGAAAGEETARIAALYWLVRRRATIGDAVMFGVGFGGTELLYRGGQVIVLLLSGKQAVSPLAALVAVEIFIFHVCLTIVVYRILLESAAAAYRHLTALGAVVYHVAIDFLGRSAILSDPTPGRALLLWSVITPLHVAVAWNLFRGRAGPIFKRMTF